MVTNLNDTSDKYTQKIWKIHMNIITNMNDTSDKYT